MEGPPLGTVTGERFRLEEELGGGAMGRVYRASDLTGGDDVAIKLIAPELSARGGLVERLEREAVLLQRVDHPAIRRVFEFGTTQDGMPFLVSELLRGRTLDARLVEEPALTAAELVEGTIVLLEGLSAVHDAGIVHRDLKPENIFIEDDGAPRIIDFGVSKGHLEGASLTGTGELLGTPVFMSPEQANRAKAAAPAADVYGVGAILYDALAGRPPFAGQSLGALLMAVAFEVPPRLTEVRPGVPSSLADLVARAMAKARAVRPASAKVFAESLKGVLEAHRAELRTLALTRAGAERSGLPEGEARPAPAVQSDARPGTIRSSFPWVVVGVAVFLALALGVVLLSLV